MKKLFCLSLALFLALSLWAEENPPKKYSLQASGVDALSNLAYLFIDDDAATCAFNANFTFMYALTKEFSLGAGCEFYFENYLNSFKQNSDGRYDQDYDQYFTFLLRPEFFYFPFKNYLKGFYLSAYPKIGFSTINYSQGFKGFFDIGLGTSCGWQHITKSGFTLNACMGAGRTWKFSSSSSLASSTDFHLFGLPFDLYMDCSLGWSF